MWVASSLLYGKQSVLYIVHAILEESSGGRFRSIHHLHDTLHSLGSDLSNYWSSLRSVRRRSCSGLGTLASHRRYPCGAHNGSIDVTQFHTDNCEYRVDCGDWNLVRLLQHVIICSNLPHSAPRKAGRTTRNLQCLDRYRRVRRCNHVRLSFIQSRLRAYFRSNCAPLCQLRSSIEVTSQRRLAAKLPGCVRSQLLLKD
jgi:hypothetical protein